MSVLILWCTKHQLFRSYSKTSLGN